MLRASSWASVILPCVCAENSIRRAAALLSLALPVTAQDKVRRVGLLSNGTASPSGHQPSWRNGILLSLSKNGYHLGQNLELVDRYSEGDLDRLPGLAREISSASVDVVVAISNPSVRAMVAATQSAPIVMVSGDPVAAGFVASMARPNGRITGLAFQNYDGDVKRLQLLREAMPAVRRFGRLGPPGPMPPRATQLLTEAARGLNIELTMRSAARLEQTDYLAVLAVLRDDGAGGVLLAAAQAFAIDAPLIGRIAQTLGLPTICEWDYMARDGCVLAYGHDLTYSHRRVGEYVTRILKALLPQSFR
jgi:putative tryptophan/tyrosine transport system substrate-binding protein